MNIVDHGAQVTDFGDGQLARTNLSATRHNPLFRIFLLRLTIPFL